MDANRYQSTVSYIIKHLLQSMEQQIKLRKLVSQIPKQLAGFCLSMAVQNLVSIMPEASKSLKVGLSEEFLGGVPKLEKDNLMPKDLSEQKHRISSPNKNSPPSSRSSMRKSKLQSAKLNDKLKSISLTQQLSAKKNTKANEECRQLLIGSDQVEDENVQQMRDKTQARLKSQQREAELIKLRRTSYQQKLKKLNQLTTEEPTDVTFDYEGDPMRATVRNEKLKLYSMRAGVGNSNRKFKEGFSKLNKPEQFKIQIDRKNKQKIDALRALRPLQIPTFHMKCIDPHQTKKLKMEQYQKHYGGKYSRLDHKTIDLNKTTKAFNQDHFNQKKHFREEQNTLDPVSRVDTGITSRKLALPRLQGKYQVLDRYQQ